MKEKTEKSKDKRLVAIKNDTSAQYMDKCGHFMAFAATTEKVIMER